MNSALLVNISRFIVLLALQIIIFNNMNFLGYISPFPYILFIILYPVNGNKTALVVASFLLGRRCSCNSLLSFSLFQTLFVQICFWFELRVSNYKTKWCLNSWTIYFYFTFSINSSPYPVFIGNIPIDLYIRHPYKNLVKYSILHHYLHYHNISY